MTDDGKVLIRRGVREVGGKEEEEKCPAQRWTCVSAGDQSKAGEVEDVSFTGSPFW